MEPKYGFSGVCPKGHKLEGAFDRDDVRRDLVAVPTKLDLYCMQCKKGYPLTPEQIARAKADLEIK